MPRETLTHPTHFFKYYNAHVAKIVLATSKVRWSSPVLFNDPFDCYFSLEPKVDLAAIKNEHRDRLLDVIFQEQEPAFVSGNPLVSGIRELRKTAQRETREELARRFDIIYPSIIKGVGALSRKERETWIRQRRDYRLFCVCEINDNLLLWSHYTACHTGVAFQFECIKELDVPLLAALPVTYADDVPGVVENKEELIEFSLGLRGMEPPANLWKRLITMKARCWEYEKEWRVITTSSAHGDREYEDWRFNPQEISRVFLGCRMRHEDKEDILRILTERFRHVEVYQAKQSPIMYRLDFDRVR
jgi:hypothetical protein